MVAGAASAGQAYGFGKPWVPATGVAAVQGPSYHRAATTPRFRPAPAQYPRYGALRQPPSAAYRTPAMLPRPPAPSAMAGGYPPQYSPWAAAAGPAWGQPYSGAFGYTRYPAAPFPNQFAWRPPERNWGVVPPHPPQSYFRAPIEPPVAGFRPMGPSYAGPPGSWRPAVRSPSMMPGGYPPGAPIYGMPRQPSQGLVGWPGAAAPRLGWNPAPAGLARPYWRPDAAMDRSGWRSASPFRPVGYGRSPSRVQRIAAGARNVSRPERLPGWVTTYRDGDAASPCLWCGGS